MSAVATYANGLLFTISAIYYVNRIGLDPLQLVLVGTVLETTYLIFQLPTGVLADHFSRRLSVILGLTLTGLGFGLQGLAPDFGLLLFCQVLWGVGASFVEGANDAWLADEVGAERVGPIFLLNTQWCQIAGILGLLSSVALALIDLTLPIVLSGVIYLALSLFLVFAMPERGFKPVSIGNRPDLGSLSRTLITGLKVVWSRPVLLILLAVEFFVGAASEGFDRLWGAHLLTSVGLPVFGHWEAVIWFGIIGVGGDIISLVGLQFCRGWLNRLERSNIARLFVISQAVIIVGRFIFSLSGSFELAVGVLWISGALQALVRPLFNAWLTEVIPSNVRATVLSMHGQSNAVGQIVGGPGVGLLGRAFSTRVALLATGLMLVPNLWLYSKLGGQTRSQPVEDGPVTVEV